MGQALTGRACHTASRGQGGAADTIAGNEGTDVLVGASGEIDEQFKLVENWIDQA